MLPALRLPNRKAVSDISGRGRGLEEWIEVLLCRGVTSAREVLPLHSAVVGGCLLVGAKVQEFH